MAKPKRFYRCQQCGNECLQWSGQCSECEAWNSLVEAAPAVAHRLQAEMPATAARSGYAGAGGDSVPLSDVTLESIKRLSTRLPELDRVLGGGLVAGSVVLLGGDPGIGKSTLLLQTLWALSMPHASSRVPVLYVTGEESLQQVAMRAQRLGLLPEPGVGAADSLKLYAETRLEAILAQATAERVQILVIDSIQTLYSEALSQAPGTLTQVRESAACLTRYAKQTGTAVFLIGHVTKEGALAGPRVLEHMVDTVLYFEGESERRLRLIRAVKNRFGPVNELGVFGMTERGLREVSNPSAIFLSRPEQAVSGSLVTATWEGSRPLLVEVQALVDSSHLANPRRVTVGLDHNRLAMLLAVLHRQGGVVTHDQDVFVNIVGGMRLLETSADLPVLLAILSSLRNRPWPQDMVVFGEIGLAGEIRPVPGGQERLGVAAKQGFKHAICPQGNMPKREFGTLELTGVAHLSEALAQLN